MIETVKDMRLLIATPFYEVKGWSPYIKALADTINFLARHTPIIADFFPLQGDSYVDRARNTIANWFMGADYTHLLFIDSDMYWTLNGLTKLLASDADVVGAGYPCKNNWDFFGCIIYTNEDGTPQIDDKGLIKAWGVPTGFMKIKKEVFTKLAEAQPDNYYMATTDKDQPPEKFYNFFGRIPPLGEDISFCRRWAEIGGELRVQPNITITHYGVEGHQGNYAYFLSTCPGGANDPEKGAK
jgi:hypothetical protein